MAMDRRGRNGPLGLALLVFLWSPMGNVMVEAQSQPSDESKSDSATFVFVHGSLHGAWCWYKVVASLQKKGYNAQAFDLTSLGRSKVRADSVSSMTELTGPVADYLKKTTGKVVIVGHSSGGFVISYLMELFSDRIEKAVFLAASMPLNGESYPALEPTELNKGFLEYFYADGPDAPATSFFLNSTIAESSFYPKSPPEDVTLALSLLAPQPLKPFREVLSLTPDRYGRVRRFYIKTFYDFVASQDAAIGKNPPERVFQLQSDHSAFFSTPRQLVKVLTKIERA